MLGESFKFIIENVLFFKVGLIDDAGALECGSFLSFGEGKETQCSCSQPEIHNLAKVRESFLILIKNYFTNY